MKKTGLLLIGALLSVTAFADVAVSTEVPANGQGNLGEYATQNACPSPKAIGEYEGKFVAKDSTGNIIWVSPEKAKGTIDSIFMTVIVDGVLECLYNLNDGTRDGEVVLHPYKQNFDYTEDGGTWYPYPGGRIECSGKDTSCAFTKKRPTANEA
ncbi:MAG TPA: hypothetical protein VKR58_11330, partial [Aquella sp.]|nr:hypothetical protein [Aquella sp.]